MSATKIECAEESWSPVTGCTPISEGCANCYAKRMAQRLRGRFGYPADDPFRVTLHEDRLDDPLYLGWGKPRRVFVCSMSDLFHDDVPDQFIKQVLWQAFTAPKHRFLVLTKRPRRMRAFFTSGRLSRRRAGDPCRNLWLGVSAENQARADERIPILLQIPAAVRFVSYEPALGPVDFTRVLDVPAGMSIDALRGDRRHHIGCDEGGRAMFESVADHISTKLDWIIAGGESGPGARPAHPDWFRRVRDDCEAAGVPFFFKQWGAWTPESGRDWHESEVHAWPDGTRMYRHGAELKVRGRHRLLDGREWNEYPEEATR